MDRKMIKIKMPQNQLAKLLGFMDEMLTMVESNLDDLDEAGKLAAKQLRHILNKTVKMYKDQIDENQN